MRVCGAELPSSSTVTTACAGRPDRTHGRRHRPMAPWWDQDRPNGPDRAWTAPGRVARPTHLASAVGRPDAGALGTSTGGDGRNAAPHTPTEALQWGTPTTS